MKYLIISAVLLLGGCAIFEEALDASAEQAADALNKYCANTDQASRDKFRAAVNEKFAGSAVITCPE